MLWMGERKIRFTGYYQEGDEEKMSGSTMHRT